MFEKNKLHPFTKKCLTNVLSAAEKLTNKNKVTPTDFGSNSERASVVSEHEQMMQSTYEALMENSSVTLFPRKAKKFQEWLSLNEESLLENLDISDDGDKVRFSI